MASGTKKIALNGTSWTRLDDGAAFVSGKVTSMASVKMVYMPATTAPVTLPKDTPDDFIGLDQGEAFNYAMGAGESLWAAVAAFSEANQTATVVVTRRQT